MAKTLPHIVVFIQENKTTDFYFPTLGEWGTDVANNGNLLSAPPAHDQPHDRSAWVHYRMGDYAALSAQIDNDVVIPYYSWLAKTYTFGDHHFGLGSNSTPGHLLAIGGQTPTLKNPSFGPGGKTWDLPSIFMHVQRAGLTWAAFPGSNAYPVNFYTELNSAAAKKHVHTTGDFIPMALGGKLPQLTYVWSPDGNDEHPPQSPGDSQYVTRGEASVWQRVDAVVRAGQWANTVFILTWDDWGGYADHIVTPDAEQVPDALHPKGFQVVGGSRIPLLIFGGAVLQGIDNTWHSHASIPKTIIDLLGLPPFGVPRVDHAPSLAGRMGVATNRPVPPAFGATVVQPRPPTPRPVPQPPPPWQGGLEKSMPALVANKGRSIPAPRDGVVQPKPPPPAV
jgi:hypothetical protein